MLGNYRTVFRAPGSAAFCAAGVVARLPIAMYGLGLVLIASARDGHYGFAGVLSACYVFGNALGNPLLSRLADRHGQSRVLLAGGAVHVAAVAALVLLVRADAPDAALVAPAVLAGFAYVSIGSLVRARWSALFGGRAELGTALSLESVLDELLFVVGPLVATLLATHADPLDVLYVAVAMVALGSLWLAGQRRTEPPIHPHGGEAHPSAIRARGMLLLTAATVGMGAVFATAEVAMVAYCGQHGHRALSGLALAAIALGSAASGFVYGARGHGGSARSRYLVQTTVFGLLPLVLLLAADVPVLVVCGFVLGTGIAPALIATFALVHELVPARALTEGMAWVSTGLNVGYGLGAAVVGAVADGAGAYAAFVLVIAAGLAVAGAGRLLGRRVGEPVAA